MLRELRPALVSTNAGYRLELHAGRVHGPGLLELHLKTDDPERKAAVLADMLDRVRSGGDVEVGETLVRFVPGGPQGRPELYAERFA